MLKSAPITKQFQTTFLNILVKSDKTKCNELDNENNSFSIRLWYCSRSLSRLQSINDYKENILIDWFELLKGVDKVKQVICDYAVCLF